MDPSLVFIGVLTLYYQVTEAIQSILCCAYITILIVISTLAYDLATFGYRASSLVQEDRTITPGLQQCDKAGCQLRLALQPRRWVLRLYCPPLSICVVTRSDAFRCNQTRFRSTLGCWDVSLRIGTMYS
jgi:hypothetical protein